MGLPTKGAQARELKLIDTLVDAFYSAPVKKTTTTTEY
jgi:hypothetical protein